MGETLHIFPTRLRIEEEVAKASSASGVVFTHAMLSFGDFEEKLLSEFVKQKPLGDVARWLFLFESAKSASAGNPLIHDLIDTDGFGRAAGELIQQIKLGLVGREELEKISGFAPGKEGWLKNFFARYALLLRNAGAFDSADATKMLLKKMATSRKRPKCLERFSEIRIHGVYHFTPARFELIRLTAKTIPTILHFPLPDERRLAFDFVERDVRKFQNLGAEAGLLELEFEEAEKNDNPLNLFVESLFSQEKREKIERLGESVHVLKHSGRYREIEEAAEKILSMTDGAAYSDYCLVFRDLEKYGSIVEDVFRRAGIPVYLRRGIPARSNPFIRAVLCVFEALEKNLERDEVSRLASSQYFSFLAAGVEPQDVDRLLMGAGIISGSRRQWGDKLSRVKSSDKADKHLSKNILALVGLLEKLGAASTIKKCMGAFEAVLKLLRPKPMDATNPYFLRDAFCAATLEKIMGDLRHAVAKRQTEGVRFGWRDLRRLLLDNLGNMNSPRWSNANHVYALNVHELAGRRFKTIFICGLHEGEFPAKIQRGSILTEAEKTEFNKKHAETVLAEKTGLKAGRAVFSHLGEAWEEESFLFYQSAKSAEERLFLSYSATDLEGKELIPSPFLEEISSAHPDLIVEASPAVAIGKSFERQLDAEAVRTKLLGELFDRSANVAELRPHFKKFIGTPGFRLSCEKSRVERIRQNFYREHDPAKRAALSNKFTGRLDASQTPGLGAYFKSEIRREFSPTALERYGNCPFKYFMHGVLKCEPNSIPTIQVERTDEGNAAHKILEKFYDGRPHPFPTLQESLKRLEKIMGTVFKEFEPLKRGGEAELWEVSKEWIKTSLKLYLEWEEKFYKEEPFDVLKNEFPFGGKNGAAVEIAPQGETIRFSGVIDRVDFLHREKKLRVVDYKYSSNIALREKLLKPETFFIESFQPPIYMFAALSLLNKTGNATGAFASYISVKKETKITKQKESPFDDAAGEESLKALENSEHFGLAALAMVRRMESGDFSVTPADCVFCKYTRACRRVETMEETADE